MDPRLRDPQLVPSKGPERFRDSSYCWGVIFGRGKHREGAKKIAFFMQKCGEFSQVGDAPPFS